MIYRKDGGAKFMRPVLDREAYLAFRNGGSQVAFLGRIRQGEESLKSQLVQMNYSCLPNDDGSLKGSKRASSSVGMDIDFVAPEGLSPEDRAAWLKERLAGVPGLVMARKDELGLLMLERSATKGYHLVFRRREGLSQEDNLRWASDLLGVKYDDKAKDITRVFFTTTADEHELLYLDDALFEVKAADEIYQPSADESPLREAQPASEQDDTQSAALTYNGLPYKDIIAKWWEIDVLTFELAVNLRHICGFDRELLARIIPCYDKFPQSQKMKCIDSALSEKRTQMPKRLKDVLFQVRRDRLNDEAAVDAGDDKGLDEAVQEDDRFYYNRLPKMPQGIRDSIEAVGPSLSMPVVTAVCPAIGALATGVQLDIHGTKNSLNLISYIAGDFASGKGGIDPVVEAWMSEIMAQDKMYLIQEDEWRAKKRAAKNKKDQPEEPKLPVRFLTLNNTVANLAERLANTDGKHAFSFTPEADTVAQKWKAALSDFSVMLRQSYDGSKYDREAKSADWNVSMCGTPDALYRVVNNYTDGKHAFSFTPEADTVAQKWKAALSDFSVMLRQSYDGSKYDREAKSADSASV